MIPLSTAFVCGLFMTSIQNWLLLFLGMQHSNISDPCFQTIFGSYDYDKIKNIKTLHKNFHRFGLRNLLCSYRIAVYC